MINWFAPITPFYDLASFDSYETKNEVRVKQYGLSSVKKNEVFRVKLYDPSSIKKNEVFRVKQYGLSNLTRFEFLSKF